jgi:hypothetical protein
MSWFNRNSQPVQDESRVIQTQSELRARAEIRHADQPQPTAQQRKEWAEERKRLQAQEEAWKKAAKASDDAACLKLPRR